METLAENRGVGIKYEVVETYDAGISLLGQEVKAIRARKVNLKGSLVKIENSQAFLAGAHIAPYQAGNTPRDYHPRRRRKLLLKTSELKHLIGKVSQKGLTLVPLSLYTKGAWIKLKLGLARSLRKGDKRERIKEKEFKRRKAKLEGRVNRRLLM